MFMAQNVRNVMRRPYIYVVIVEMRRIRLCVGNWSGDTITLLLVAA